MSLIADVFDVILVDNDGDVIATTTLTEANIEVSVKENDVRGGKGNQLLGILHSDRDIAINLTDAEFRYEWMAKQLGQDVVTGAGVAYAMPKWYEVVDLDDIGPETDLGFTLEHAPLTTDSGLKLFDDTGKELVLTTDYTISGSKVIIVGGVLGEMVEVRVYKYATVATTETIEIDNSVFAKGVKCILDTIEIDGEENPTHSIQYQFDRALPSGNFTINTASERTAQTQAFNLRVVKPANSTKVGKVLRVPIV